MRPIELSEMLEKTVRAKLPVLIKGSPGVGKSDIVDQVAEKLGADMILTHPVVSDPTDYKGFPFPSPDKKTAVFLPFGDLAGMIAATKLTVVFIDDLGQAPPTVQAACMQLLLARRINGHKISDEVCFVAATNRREDRAGVKGILEPVKSRFVTIVEIEPNIDDWVHWALREGINVELIAFLRFRPELLIEAKPTLDIVNSPCPRTWHNVDRLLKAGIDGYEPISGAVGEGAAAEFIGYRKVFTAIPTVEKIIMNPAKAIVPTEPSALYAVSAVLAQRASEQNFDQVVEYINRMPADYSTLVMTDVVNRDQGLTNTKPFITWAAEHSDVFF